MSLILFFANLLGPSRTWTVTIEVDGELITATASEENGSGMWLVTYQERDKPHPTSKWITPTMAQRQERFESKK